jgi:uncharacterized repeat protein (TIGR01451 family)
MGWRANPGLRSVGLLAAAATLALVLALVPARAGAGEGVTFSSTQVLPVPPASNFAGQGGGDGWGIALRSQVSAQNPSAQYNVFHHSSDLTVACHLQSDGTKACWEPKTVQDSADVSNRNFAVGGHVGLYLDHQTNKLYIYATRESDSTSGVVCFDTIVADSADGNPFCGFTPLSAVGEGAWEFDGSYLSEPMVVGSRFYAFNFVNSAAPAGGNSHTQNTLLCFDATTTKACAGQPYTMAIGDGTIQASNFPPPGSAAIGSDIIVSMHLQPNADRSSTDLLACFDTQTQAKCSGSWPVEMHTFYPSSAGAPFPLLSASGAVRGVCLPFFNGQIQDPCWTLDGASTDTPAGLAQAVPTTSGWSGQAVVMGPRVYVPNGNSNSVDCFDYSTGTCNPAAQDAIFPKRLTNLSLLYSVNSDPQRPTCLWVNADNGSAQIQNFDAFTGGACGAGPIRLPGSFFIVDAPECTPGSYTSLQVVSPANAQGSVTFADPSGNPLTAQPVQLDATGTADLTGLNLNSQSGLPQFLITLNRGDNAPPTSVTVKLTWTGNFDANCAKGTTTTPPPPTPPTTSTAPPAQSNVAVTISAPPVVRVGEPATFTATVTNTGKDAAQGVEVTFPIVGGGTLNSVTPSQGTCITTTVVHCYLGSLPAGGSTTVTFKITPTRAGTLNVSAHVTGDHNTSGNDDNASAPTPALDPGAPPPAPPAPTQPGTVNAISTGTVKVNGVAIVSDTVFLLKSGDTVELNGYLTFTTIGGAVGTFSNVPFTASRSVSSTRAQLRAAVDGPPTTFTVSAPNDAAGLTNLTLVGSNFASCTSPRTVTANKPSSKVVQQLWGKAKGNFRTTAKFSSATIRGTTWGIQDRCDGSLTTALDDPVDVFDTVLNKTVTITGGQTYLAQPAAFKPPTIKLAALAAGQTVKTVKAKGLRLGAVTYKTRAQLAAYLTKAGSSYAAFAAKYPALAKALASRKK